MKQPWWQNEIIYQIYPMSFKDSNGDGIGDLQGIISKLDYIQSLGVTMIWTSPFFESPNDDNGYDISDYTAIGKDYGTMEDFDLLLAEVKKRGMKLIVDTVVSHSSDEHAWFQESKSSKKNPKRDWYIWRDAKPDGSAPNNWPAFFGGSTWEWDENTQQYYLHLFRAKQPDLNWENPEVREAIKDVLRFWLEKGVVGYRMDVISLISKRLAFPDAPEDYTFEDIIQDLFSNGPRIHEFLRELDRDVFSKYDAYTMGEGPGITTKTAMDYIGFDRQELSTIYHFDHLNLDHGPGGRFDLKEWKLTELKQIINEWDRTVGDNAWYCFSLGNHDFGRMVNRYGSVKYRDKSAKALAVLLMTLRATPIIYQGDEIGMTNTHINSIDEVDDVYTTGLYEKHIAQGWNKDKLMEAVNVQSRDHARTPMPWDSSEQGGFTSGKPWLKLNPNFTEINVANAGGQEDSILDFYRKVIAVRKEYDAFTYGSYVDLKPNDEQLICFERNYNGIIYRVLINFSDSELEVSPKDIYGDLLLSNYKNISDTMQPWEARIYKF